MPLPGDIDPFPIPCFHRCPVKRRSVGSVPLEHVGVEVAYYDLFQVPSFRWQVEVMTIGYLGAESLPTRPGSLTH